jgi:hypothetical protein
VYWGPEITARNRQQLLLAMNQFFVAQDLILSKFAMSRGKEASFVDKDS